MKIWGVLGKLLLCHAPEHCNWILRSTVIPQKTKLVQDLDWVMGTWQEGKGKGHTLWNQTELGSVLAPTAHEGVILGESISLSFSFSPVKWMHLGRIKWVSACWELSLISSAQHMWQKQLSLPKASPGKMHSPVRGTEEAEKALGH